MTRTLAAIAAVGAGLVAQAWLLNPMLYWLWAAGFFPGKHPDAMRNAGFCSLPCFLIFLGQAAIVWFMAVRPALVNRRRRKSGHCAECGYDLTGNVSGRCPECGKRLSSTMNESGV